MKRALLLLALAGIAPLHAGEPVTNAADALARAKKAHQPVLLDFRAPWCYSCYFMATHVLNGAEWNAVEAKTVVAEIDADSPDGAAWMKKLQVKALPAYVVLDENGDELGRILAEQPREKFYPNLEKILAGASTLDGYQRKAAAGSIDAVATVLGSYQARNDGRQGLAWYRTLPKAVRERVGTDRHVAPLLDRLELARAVEAKDDAAATKAAERALAGDIGCDRPYVVDQLLESSAKLPKARREALLGAQKTALTRLLDEHVFVKQPDCADQRSSVIATADVDAALGDAAAEKAVLDRGIAAARAGLGDDLARDRNLADNLRVYLARAKRTDELDALYPKLIAAYPDDYVYAYRYGRSLLERGHADTALPLLEKAADKAYGENRLVVATLRVKALKALNRRGDAEKVVSEVLEQNGQWFPDEVARLKAALNA